jgi:hypothetical protein
MIMWEDPIVAEVRRVREQLAAKFNYDVHAIFEDMRKREALRSSNLVSPPPKRKRRSPKRAKS